MFRWLKVLNKSYFQTGEGVLMKLLISTVVIIFSLLNFHCGSSSNIETNKVEKTKKIEAKPKLNYSGIYIDNSGKQPGIWYVNSKDSVKKLILNLPSNYGLSADNFKLSPSDKFLAFYDFDSLKNRTNVYSINLNNRNLAWLKSDRGKNGVDLAWKNDSLLYCNISSNNNYLYPEEKYTSLINVDKNKAIKTFTPAKGNRLVGFIANKYLLYEFDPGNSDYQNEYYLIEKNNNKLFKEFKKEDNSNGLVYFEMSTSGKEFFHIPNKVFRDENGKSINEEELVVQKVSRSAGETISHTPSGFKDVTWSPAGNIISFLKVGSINYNTATKNYTDIRYLFFYDVNSKQLTNLKTYEVDSVGGVKTEFDIPKTLPNGATVFNYIDYKWSPSGKYLFINRQDLSLNSVINKCIIYNKDSKSEKTLIDNYEGRVKVEGWWDDDFILLSENGKYTFYDLRNDRSANITLNGRILYLKEEDQQHQ